MRVAFSSMVWNTGSRSPGELEMTLSTSEVAVCCSSDSASSRMRVCTCSAAARFDSDHGLIGEGRDQLDLLVVSSVRWRSSLSSRAFSMAITAWAAKLLTSSICLSVNGCTSWR